MRFKKKLIMGESHSLRPNKEYMNPEALNWINEQENSNEAICRAVQYYYTYFEDGKEAAARLSVGTVRRAEAQENDVIEDKVDTKEAKLETIEIAEGINQVSTEALSSFKNMMGSLKR